MKKLFTVLAITSLSILSYGQCLIEPWSLQKRTDKSDVIVEAKVISQEGTWDQNHGNIFTINTLEVYKVFKGQLQGATIQLVTEGGIVGLDKQDVNPSLELQNGEVGIFLIKNCKVSFDRSGQLYQPTASVQSFIKYDLNAVKALDIFNTYASIKFQLYPSIEVCTGSSYKNIKDFDAEANNKTIKALAPPVITSFSANTVNAGASIELIISGSNFGFAKGRGGVGFKDANFGDGRYYYSPTSWSYNSWSNSQIKVIVPSRAGTGKVEVTNNNGESGESSFDLTVDWSHLNVDYPATASDTPFFEKQLVDDNSNGGYTWQMTTEFASNIPAVGAFTRSLNEWKCETEVNWELGTNTTTDTAISDGINIVEFTTYGDSRLGVCRSFSAGCFVNGSDMRWYVTELDISFDRTYSWYYGTVNPSPFQFDFESVATHELGHGHQLGHVRDASKVMHYSISNGDRKPELAITDVACGNYVKTKSITNTVCSKAKMTVGICPSNPPIADYTVDNTNPCPGTNIVITDASVGNSVSYAWDFGTGATPATASTKGPHTISYSSAGTTIVRLIASNVSGADTLDIPVIIKNNTLGEPSVFATSTDACFGKQTYAVENVTNAVSYTWVLNTGGSITTNGNREVEIDWDASGNHILTVNANSECPTTLGGSRSAEISVLANPIARFSEIVDGTKVTFTNESENGTSYLWTFGDGGTSSEENPVHNYADKGDFTTSLSVINRCGDSSLSKDFKLLFRVGVEDLENRFNVYPNPVRNGKTVTIEGDKADSYSLYSLDGKLIHEGVVVNNSLVVNVLVPAVYVLTLKKDGESINYRIQVTE